MNKISTQKIVYDLRPQTIMFRHRCHTHISIVVINDHTIEAVFGSINGHGFIPDPGTCLRITGDNIPHDLINAAGEFKPFRLDIFVRQICRLLTSKRTC